MQRLFHPFCFTETPTQFLLPMSTRNETHIPQKKARFDPHQNNSLQRFQLHTLNLCFVSDMKGEIISCTHKDIYFLETNTKSEVSYFSLVSSVFLSAFLSAESFLLTIFLALNYPPQGYYEPGRFYSFSLHYTRMFLLRCFSKRMPMNRSLWHENEILLIEIRKIKFLVFGVFSFTSKLFVY